MAVEVSDKERKMLADDLLAVKEMAVHEHRNWVRTTYSCNNRCIFCLDGDVPPKGHIDEAEVFKKIKDGYKPGARLIVSGGEASIHPAFLKFIAYGKKLGYSWIQTITNGRMFAYPKIAKAAADAGLNEVTFSMHGHNSKLHDELTGIKGGFAHSLRGMVNLLKDGRVVVNVDCVINGINYKYLDDILKFYMAMGIHEFDLLQIVPFGRAWWPENRERMFYNVDAAFPYLNKAFKHAYKPGNYIWTNRFPVQFLEDIEELIQDPHKLYDEVNGRRQEFQNFIDNDKKLECYPERCEFCFIQDFCKSLYDLQENLEQGSFVKLVADLTDKADQLKPQAVGKIFDSNKVKQIKLIAKDYPQASLYLESIKEYIKDRKIKITLQLSNWTEFFETLKKNPATIQKSILKNIVELVVDEPELIEQFINSKFSLSFTITNNIADKLSKYKSAISKRSDIAFDYPSVETLTEAQTNLPDPEQFFETWKKSKIKVSGVPKCIHPNSQKYPTELRLACLDEDGKIDMNKFTADYILYEYFEKSRRCKECKHFDNCKGLNINAIRVHRFKQLKPILES